MSLGKAITYRPGHDIYLNVDVGTSLFVYKFIEGPVTNILRSIFVPNLMSAVEEDAP